MQISLSSWRLLRLVVLTALLLSGCAIATEAPTVVIAPQEGPPGTTVQVSADGFDANTDVQIGAGPEDAEFVVRTSVQSDADGRVSEALIIPETAAPDSRWVIVARAIAPDGERATSSVFDVTGEGPPNTPLPTSTITPTSTATPADTPTPEPSVAISPPSGPPGTDIQVSASGFPANTEVQVGAGREGSEFGTTKTAQTDAEGQVTTSITVPDFAEPGDPWVVVVRVVAQGGVRATSDIFVIEEGVPTATPMPSDDEPSVVISPLSGPPGTEIEVTASGFPANTEVQVGAGREGSEFGTTKMVQTDAEGRLSTTITLPDFAEIGDPWGVVVRVLERGGVRASSGTFEVTAPQEGSEDLFERTHIYLIAVGDDGQSGQEIGCDDSVVPVEVVIEPTIAPLTAGLEKLLSIDEEYYGQSGLYNALYRSDLQVEGINIENREAIIHLTGTLRLGGVCDEPCVRAQLEQTALQFSTVDRVSVFINGKPLEDFMGGQGG